MNIVQGFEQLSKGLTFTDITLYGGILLVLWVLFKDKLGGVTEFVKDLLSNKSTVRLPEITKDSQLFFELIASWKKTRDLAEQSGCVKAVEAVDQLFPHLNPVTCEGHKNESANVKK